MYKTRFAGTYPLAPTAKDNRNEDSLLSYYPRTLRQAKTSPFARRMTTKDGTGCPSSPGLDKECGAGSRNHRRPYSRGGPQSLPRACRRMLLGVRVSAHQALEYSRPRSPVTPCAAVLRPWPRNPYRTNTPMRLVITRWATGGPRETPSCASCGLWRLRDPFLDSRTTDPCQLSFRWKRFELSSRVD